jgi:hypothetical protein
MLSETPSDYLASADGHCVPRSICDPLTLRCIAFHVLISPAVLSIYLKLHSK